MLYLQALDSDALIKGLQDKSQAKIFKTQRSQQSQEEDEEDKPRNRKFEEERKKHYDMKNALSKGRDLIEKEERDN